MSRHRPSIEALDSRKLEFASGMFKALGHPLRLQLVDLLELRGELSVGELTELSGQPQPTVSFNLGKLKTLGLLGSRREGTQVFYFLEHEKLPVLLDCIRDCPLD